MAIKKTIKRFLANATPATPAPALATAPAVCRCRQCLKKTPVLDFLRKRQARR